MKEDYFALACLLTGFSPGKILFILKKAGSFEKLWKATKKELISFGLSQSEAEEFLFFQKKTKVEEFWQGIRKRGIKTVCLTEENYPPLLKEVSFPPLVLFYQGNLPEKERKILAVVGSRLSSFRGKHLAEEISAELSKRGFTIVSGLARGIDTYAHLGALKGEGKTIAVLGCGLDVDYPPENKTLKRKIAEEGIVLTEFLPGTEPLAYNFPRRNRIIAGLSQAVIVIEARLKSGALITAHLAADYGREVMVFPGNPENPYAKGCNRLIKEGACLVENLEDILEVLGFDKESLDKESSFRKAKIELSEKEKEIVGLLEDGPRQADEIIRTCGQEAAYLLTLLEIKGVVSREAGQVFSLNYQAS